MLPRFLWKAMKLRIYNQLYNQKQGGPQMNCNPGAFFIPSLKEAFAAADRARSEQPHTIVTLRRASGSASARARYPVMHIAGLAILDTLLTFADDQPALVAFPVSYACPVTSADRSMAMNGGETTH
jgi:hypothetical protein